MSEPDNHIDNRGAFVDSVLLKVQNSGIDYAKNIKAPVSVVLAEARQKLDQYYADFYRNKIPEKVNDWLDENNYEMQENASKWRVEGYNACIDTITAQFNSKGDNDE